MNTDYELDYFGARYLEPMLGMWISVDPARQFASPYLYGGNGYNPVNAIDPDGNAAFIQKNGNNVNAVVPVWFWGPDATTSNVANVKSLVAERFSGQFGKYNVKTIVVDYDEKIHGSLNNYVWLEKDAPSYVDNSTLPQNAYINTESKRNILHEFGHLLGLDDRYTNNDDGTSSAHKGYGANLMGVHGEYGIKEEQIEEIFKGPGSAGNYIDE